MARERRQKTENNSLGNVAKTTSKQRVVRIDKPNQQDVLLGRGPYCASHNRPTVWKFLIHSSRERYARCTKKFKKREVIEFIICETKKRGGRFLTKYKVRKDLFAWKEVDDTLAYQKTSQALREIQKDRQIIRDFAARMEEHLEGFDAENELNINPEGESAADDSWKLQSFSTARHFPQSTSPTIDSIFEPLRDFQGDIYCREGSTGDDDVLNHPMLSAMKPVDSPGNVDHVIQETPATPHTFEDRDASHIPFPNNPNECHRYEVTGEDRSVQQTSFSIDHNQESPGICYIPRCTAANVIADSLNESQRQIEVQQNQNWFDRVAHRNEQLQRDGFALPRPLDSPGKEYVPQCSTPPSGNSYVFPGLQFEQDRQESAPYGIDIGEENGVDHRSLLTDRQVHSPDSLYIPQYSSPVADDTMALVRASEILLRRGQTMLEEVARYSPQQEHSTFGNRSDKVAHRPTRFKVSRHFDITTLIQEAVLQNALASESDDQEDRFLQKHGPVLHPTPKKLAPKDRGVAGYLQECQDGSQNDVSFQPSPDKMNLENYEFEEWSNPSPPQDIANFTTPRPSNTDITTMDGLVVFTETPKNNTPVLVPAPTPDADTMTIGMRGTTWNVSHPHNQNEHLDFIAQLQAQCMELHASHAKIRKEHDHIVQQMEALDKEQKDLAASQNSNCVVVEEIQRMCIDLVSRSASIRPDIEAMEDKAEHFAGPVYAV